MERNKEMDNFKIDIISDSNLQIALELAMRRYKAVSYIKTPTELILFWSPPPESTLLPTPLNAEKASIIVKEWLENEAQYPPEPDTDGSIGKGWRISCDAWGHVKPYGWKGLVRIEPVCAEYGK